MDSLTSPSRRSLAALGVPLGNVGSVACNKQYIGSLTKRRGVRVGNMVAELSAGSDSPEGEPPLGGLPKRALDIAVASIVLLLLAPIMLIVTVLIRVLMGGPPIFAQERIGCGGRVFVCYKFRTMVTNGEEILHRYLDAKPEAAREWKETRKLANDPRVGCLGNILRKSSLDELPQLFNVLCGDMSLVGPRPVVSDELKYYGCHAQDYLKARPGVTGLWQVSGRNRLNYAARVARDCHYVRNWSLAVDLVILIKTIPAVLKFSETA